MLKLFRKDSLTSQTERIYEDENIWLTQKMMAGPMSRFSTS